MSSFRTEEEATKIPLFLATRSGYVEIVQEILTLYPQAVEHIDERGRNILHIAIKYRHLKIFKLVTKMDLSLKRLVRKLDDEGNSILHTVGKKIRSMCLKRCKALHWNCKMSCIGLRCYTLLVALFFSYALGVHACT